MSEKIEPTREERDAIIEDQDVVLDGGMFTGCTFRRCRMVFAGTGARLHFGANRTEECTWELVGGAGAGLQFLSQLYHNGGEGGRELVETTFDNIREGRLL